MTVPVPIPTTDGRLFVDGLVVMKYIEGGPPETNSDWRRVAGTLRELHRLTQGWPQRPGWNHRQTCCRPKPERGSTSRRCRPKALFDVVQRGRGSSGVRHALSTDQSVKECSRTCIWGSRVAVVESSPVCLVEVISFRSESSRGLSS